MRRCASLAVIAAIMGCGLGFGSAPAQAQGKVCHMEQQCHWENFKKICTYVKVCR